MRDSAAQRESVIRERADNNGGGGGRERPRRERNAKKNYNQWARHHYFVYVKCARISAPAKRFVGRFNNGVEIWGEKFHVSVYNLITFPPVGAKLTLCEDVNVIARARPIFGVRCDGKPPVTRVAQSSVSHVKKHIRACVSVCVWVCAPHA